jgi:hypothetical protein
MDEVTEFVSNYHDHSTNEAFQFEFCCNRCGTGYRSPVKGWATGRAAGILGTASSIFGGLFGSAARVGEHVRSSAWQSAHDAAFREASAALKPEFIQCPRCQTWVCRRSCWNNKRGMCKGCAPDLGVEMSAAQASQAVQSVWDKAAVDEDDAKVIQSAGNKTVLASCPHCEAPLAGNPKFCPGCGAPLKVSENCAKCGAKLPPKSKFCPECGEKSSG